MAEVWCTHSLCWRSVGKLSVPSVPAPSFHHQREKKIPIKKNFNLKITLYIFAQGEFFIGE